ncbi:MAG: hypothetical protein Q4D54_01055 [Eubacteriales bacterium]|nr:hypothetical protein [Eubacteriales bacterium]
MDPTPNDDDKSRFVDESVGMILEESFETSITFPRLTETAHGFDNIMKSHSKEIISGYNVWQTEDRKYIYITQRVWNLSFIQQ